MRFIQGKFANSRKTRTVEDVSKVYSKLALQGKLSAAMKPLDNESLSSLLDLSPDILQGLQDKHPEAADVTEESLLHVPVDYIPPNVYDLIDKKNDLQLSKQNQGLSRAIENGLGAL